MTPDALLKAAARYERTYGCRAGDGGTADMLRAGAAAMEEAERLLDLFAEIKQWAGAYPLAVFPEPDFKRANDLLQAGGMSIDAISASNMRHVLRGVERIAETALQETRNDG